MIHIPVEEVGDSWDILNEILQQEEEAILFRGAWYIQTQDIKIDAVSSRSTFLVLEDIGYAKQKARHLINAYLSPLEFKTWVRRLLDTTVKYGSVDTDSAMLLRRGKHTHGPCMIAMSYRTIGPTLTVYSRALELPRKSLADAMLVSAVGEILREYLELDQLGVIWYVGTVYIESRRAKFRLIHKYPEDAVYQHAKFNKSVHDGFMDWVVGGKEGTYSELLRAQKFYKDKCAGRLGRTGVDTFVSILREML